MSGRNASVWMCACIFRPMLRARLLVRRMNEVKYSPRSRENLAISSSLLQGSVPYFNLYASTAGSSKPYSHGSSTRLPCDDTRMSMPSTPVSRTLSTHPSQRRCTSGYTSDTVPGRYSFFPLRETDQPSNCQTIPEGAFRRR